MRPLRLLIVLFAALAVTPMVLSAPASAAVAATARTACAAAIDIVERARRTPLKLLDAISLVESGRSDAAGQAIFAWPWTIYARGEGRYFATKEGAIAAVRRLRAEGVSSIDVGCMQVNLHFHPDAFASLEEAFDPLANVAYAAGFLTDLRHATRSWSRAVAQYHSATPAHGRPYWQRVRVAWSEARRRHYRERREAGLRAAQARRAAQQAAILAARAPVAR